MIFILDPAMQPIIKFLEGSRFLFFANEQKLFPDRPKKSLDLTLIVSCRMQTVAFYRYILLRLPR